jgi:hypothetical protein
MATDKNKDNYLSEVVASIRFSRKYKREFIPEFDDG